MGKSGVFLWGEDFVSGLNKMVKAAMGVSSWSVEVCKQRLYDHHKSVVRSSQVGLNDF